MSEELRGCPYSDTEVSRKLRTWIGVHVPPGLSDLLQWSADIIDRRAEQDNPELTLEELRGMDGEPVFTKTKGVIGSGRWELICFDEHWIYFKTALEGETVIPTEECICPDEILKDIEFRLSQKKGIYNDRNEFT